MEVGGRGTIGHKGSLGSCIVGTLEPALVRDVVGANRGACFNVAVRITATGVSELVELIVDVVQLKGGVRRSVCVVLVVWRRRVWVGCSTRCCRCLGDSRGSLVGWSTRRCPLLDVKRWGSVVGIKGCCGSLGYNRWGPVVHSNGSTWWCLYIRWAIL